ncbi:MAG: EAL domain-containing protein, partial [Gammaproteobacteria bacterium]
HEQLQRIVDSIPVAMQYPETSCARLILEDREYCSDQFKTSRWKLASELAADAGVSGRLEVFYRDKKPDADEGPFLQEERILINLLTVKISQFIERRNNLKRLEESERFARATLNGLSANIAIIDEIGTIIATNKTWADFARNNSGNLSAVSEGANYLDTCEKVSGAEQEMAKKVLAGIKEVMQGRLPEFTMEYTCDAPDQPRWFIARITRFPGEGPLKLIIAHENITPQKLAEQRLLRLNRIHNVLSGINNLIVRTTSSEDLLRECCELAIEAGGFRMAWIGQRNTVDKVFTPMARAGHDAGYLETLTKVYRTESNPDKLTLNRALRTMQPLVHNNVASDLVSFTLKQEALKRGFQSMGVFPFVIDNHHKGIMAFYSSEPGFFDEEEVTLLSELAGDIAYALKNLQKQERIDYLVSYDPLTQLPNRNMFFAQVKRLLAQAKAGKDEHAILVCNLLKFRRISNLYGQTISDQLLQHVARHLGHLTEYPSYIARISGDTFAMIVTRGQDEAGRVFMKLLNALASEPIFIKGHNIHVNLTGGIASFSKDSDNPEELYRYAEIAMENASQNEKHYMFFDQAMTRTIVEEADLQDALHNALVNDEFVLYYQPKVELVSGKICGLEALIRWDRPGTGLVPPFKFIPALEKSSLIRETGNWVLQQAARDWLAWKKLVKLPPTIAVNVSSVQLREQDFINQVKKAINTDAGTVPLEIEITESMLMFDLEDNIDKLNQIRKNNIRVAIDDFGTGYSSLSYIARLPVDCLKIDKSFVSTMAEQPDSMTIVSTIITLAHALNLSVVAEGVETEEQAKLLRLLRCNEVQGYLYSKPVSAQKIRDILENGGLS